MIAGMRIWGTVGRMVVSSDFYTGWASEPGQAEGRRIEPDVDKAAGITF
jgi:hypothetical protein